MKVVENRWKFVIIPSRIVVLGIVMYIVNGGFNFDVEFLGGTRMQVELKSEFDNDELSQLILDKTGASAKVQKSGNSATQAVIKVQATENEDETKIAVMDTLKEKFAITDAELISSSTA